MAQNTFSVPTVDYSGVFSTANQSIMGGLAYLATMQQQAKADERQDMLSAFAIQDSIRKSELETQRLLLDMAKERRAEDAQAASNLLEMRKYQLTEDSLRMDMKLKQMEVDDKVAAKLLKSGNPREFQRMSNSDKPLTSVATYELMSAKQGFWNLPQGELDFYNLKNSESKKLNYYVDGAGFVTAGQLLSWAKTGTPEQKQKLAAGLLEEGLEPDEISRLTGMPVQTVVGGYSSVNLVQLTPGMTASDFSMLKEQRREWGAIDAVLRRRMESPDGPSESDMALWRDHVAKGAELAQKEGALFAAGLEYDYSTGTLREKSNTVQNRLLANANALEKMAATPTSRYRQEIAEPFLRELSDLAKTRPGSDPNSLALELLPKYPGHAANALMAAEALRRLAASTSAGNPFSSDKAEVENFERFGAGVTMALLQASPFQTFETGVGIDPGSVIGNHEAQFALNRKLASEKSRESVLQSVVAGPPGGDERTYSISKAAELWNGGLEEGLRGRATDVSSENYKRYLGDVLASSLSVLPVAASEEGPGPRVKYADIDAVKIIEKAQDPGTYGDLELKGGVVETLEGPINIPAGRRAKVSVTLQDAVAKGYARGKGGGLLYFGRKKVSRMSADDAVEHYAFQQFYDTPYPAPTVTRVFLERGVKKALAEGGESLAPLGSGFYNTTGKSYGGAVSFLEPAFEAATPILTAWGLFELLPAGMLGAATVGSVEGLATPTAVSITAPVVGALSGKAAIETGAVSAAAAGLAQAGMEAAKDMGAITSETWKFVSGSEQWGVGAANLLAASMMSEASKSDDPVVRARKYGEAAAQVEASIRKSSGRGLVGNLSMSEAGTRVPLSAAAAEGRLDVPVIVRDMQWLGLIAEGKDLPNGRPSSERLQFEALKAGLGSSGAAANSEAALEQSAKTLLTRLSGVTGLTVRQPVDLLPALMGRTGPGADKVL